MYWRAFSEINEVSSLRERSDPQRGRDSECAKIAFLHAFAGCANKGVRDAYMFHLLFVNTLPHFSWNKLEISDEMFFFHKDVFFFQQEECHMLQVFVRCFSTGFLFKQKNLQFVRQQKKPTCQTTKELEVKDDQFVRCRSPHQLQLMEPS